MHRNRRNAGKPLLAIGGDVIVGLQRPKTLRGLRCADDVAGNEFFLAPRPFQSQALTPTGRLLMIRIEGKDVTTPAGFPGFEPLWKSAGNFDFVLAESAETRTAQVSYPAPCWIAHNASISRPGRFFGRLRFQAQAQHRGVSRSWGGCQVGDLSVLAFFRGATGARANKP